MSVAGRPRAASDRPTRRRREPTGRFGALRAKLRLPNTRSGAALAAAGIGIVGFALGIALLVVVPVLRSGQGPLAFLSRPPRPPVIDPRLRPPSHLQNAPRERNERPELWFTPTASVVFPSPQAMADVRGTPGVVDVTYVPAVSPPVIAFPPIRNAVGRAVVSTVVVMAPDDALTTPGPLRPGPVEASQVTVAASAAGGGGTMACVLALRESELRAVATIGPTGLDECQAGMIRLEGEGLVAFAIEFDLLPNYRAQDGAWREGGVFGRTRVWVTLRATTPG